MILRFSLRGSINPPSLLECSLALPLAFTGVAWLFEWHTEGDLSRISKGLALMGGRWALLPCKTCPKEKKSLRARTACSEYKQAAVNVLPAGPFQLLVMLT